MKIIERIVAITIVSVFLCLCLLVLTGCDIEDGECAVEDRYISHYEEITYPSGDVILQPVWVCP